jgi:hypothetical protein
LWKREYGKFQIKQVELKIGFMALQKHRHIQRVINNPIVSDFRIVFAQHDTPV